MIASNRSILSSACSRVCRSRTGEGRAAPASLACPPRSYHAWGGAKNRIEPIDALRGLVVNFKTEFRTTFSSSSRLITRCAPMALLGR